MIYLDEAEIVSVNKPYEDGKKIKFIDGFRYITSTIKYISK